VKTNELHWLVEHSAMNRLQLTSTWKDESAVSSEDELDEPGFSSESPAVSQNSIEPWLLIFTGFSSATFVTNLICRPPQPHATSWIFIFLQSIFFLALTAAAGAAGIFVPWFFLRTKPLFPFGSLAKKIAVGWVFLPCITLLYRRHSPWMVPVLAIATMAVAFNIRLLFPAAAAPLQTKALPWQTADLPALYGLPGPDSHPLRSFFLALSLQGALIAAITESLFLAGILLSTSTFLLVWRWSAFDRDATRKFTGERSSILLCALAIFITMLLLIPPADGRSHSAFGGWNQPNKPPSLANRPLESDRPSSDYVGIILWPPPIKKEVLPPIPPPHSFAFGGASRPVIIPFDGPYWYFKAPSKRPGPRAHIAHGKSTDVTVRSSDWAPLLMEAHQNLGSSIDLSCCSEIDVTITNADSRPGKIALGLLLTDSNSTGKPSHDLGERTIVSTEAARISMNRPPVKETLRFPILRSTTIHRFDEITIVFLPAKERARGSAKVSIDSFTLIPR